ncbi:MAG: hypothetical protein OQJ91_10895 [Motiliproteus sp.]|nr:hypothetical protein [Motiliproteus sp.]
MKKTIVSVVAVLVVIFVGWMAVIHQPKTESKELVLGIVAELPERSAAQANVTLADGTQVLANKPKFIPSQVGLKVRMQMTEYQWSGERQFDIKSWSTR